MQKSRNRITRQCVLLVGWTFSIFSPFGIKFWFFLYFMLKLVQIKTLISLKWLAYPIFANSDRYQIQPFIHTPGKPPWWLSNQ